MQTDNGEEILDLVDEHDVVIGSMPREEIYAKNLTNFRVVNIFIVNSEGKLWIPRRTAHKKLFPLYLDMSAAGHVSSGETYEEAAAKELKEETGLNLAELPHRDLGYLSPKDGVHVHMRVYEVLYDKVPAYDSGEFCEYFWLTPQELIEKVNNGDKAKSDLVVLVTHFYL